MAHEIREIVRGIIRDMDNDELGAFLADVNDEVMRRAYQDVERKRQHDRERHLAVSCPACGAKARVRCLRRGQKRGIQRSDISHPERAWKACECPECGALPGDWCENRTCLVTYPHGARVDSTRKEA